MNSLKELREELAQKANPAKAKILQGFFKTGKGEYGEGDEFYGITVPETRSTAKKFREVGLKDAKELLKSKIHEERLCALLILIQKFEDKKTTDAQKKEIYEFYLANTPRINNWDLVDLSAHEIVGAFLWDNPKEVPLLKKLAKSELLWERRIAMVACYRFIYRKQFKEALEVAQILLRDEHDLIQKAVGWMLREIGKRDLATEEKFLKKNYKTMPRTMLRYAIEKFPEKKRQKYLRRS